MKSFKFLFVFIIFVGCDSNRDISFESVTSRNGYEIDVLKSMEPTVNLNNEASLQFFDEKRQLFMIVLDESKNEMNEAVESDEELSTQYSSDFEGYTTFLLDNFAYSMNVKRGSRIKDTIINEFPAKTITLVSEIDEVDIFYSLAFIEGKQKYYQIWTWTYADQEKDYFQIMNKIIYSFKENEN